MSAIANVRARTLSMLPFRHEHHAFTELFEQCISCIRVISSQFNGAHCVIDLRRSATKDPLPLKVLVPTLSKPPVILLANSAYHPTYKIRNNYCFLLPPRKPALDEWHFEQPRAAVSFETTRPNNDEEHKRRNKMVQNPESARLEEAHTANTPWRKWGPYLSERQWGTVREDYSQDGNAWDYFTHDQARSRAYHWGEDGLAGISDDKQLLCFSVALWNGKDPILKERMFGLTNSEANHGEDVKEYYFYLDSTPTHSYMKYLYKYPQAEYPYSI